MLKTWFVIHRDNKGHMNVDFNIKYHNKKNFRSKKSRGIYLIGCEMWNQCWVVPHDTFVPHLFITKRLALDKFENNTILKRSYHWYTEAFRVQSQECPKNRKFIKMKWLEKQIKKNSCLLCVMSFFLWTLDGQYLVALSGSRLEKKLSMIHFNKISAVTACFWGKSWD